MNINMRLATTDQELAAACHRLAVKWFDRGNMTVAIHYQKYSREYARLARQHMNVE